MVSGHTRIAYLEFFSLIKQIGMFKKNGNWSDRTSIVELLSLIKHILTQKKMYLDSVSRDNVLGVACISSSKKWYLVISVARFTVLDLVYLCLYT